MKHSNAVGIVIFGLSLSLGVPQWTHSAEPAASPVQWIKTVVDKKFRAEGVAVGDVNRDGKKDIMVGDVWYEAPAWTMREIRPIARDYGDGAGGYSESFACFADDFNKDGWVDLLVVGMPGQPAYWYENPQNKAGHWKQRMVWASACNETPLYTELFGDGKKYLIMAIQPEGQMAYFSPDADIEKKWNMHPISKASTKDERVPGTDQYSHGLGTGDINKDGRADVIIKQGWWEQPANAKQTDQPWTFHAADVSPDCADMYAFDVNGDGLNDVLSSAAHQKGVWWHQQVAGKGGKEFTHHDIPHDFSQSHAMHFVDMNGDNKKDLVTGKRWWAHGPNGDVEPNAPAVIRWIEIKSKPGAAPEFVTHPVDNDSGIGTQFEVADVNGDNLPDIVVANKKGVHLFKQLPRTRR